MPAASLLKTTFEPTLRLIRQIKAQGGPYRQLRAAARAMGLFRYLPGHIELLRLMSHPHAAGLTDRQPKLVYKYLSKSYLVESFSTRARLRILLNHYGYLMSRVRADFMIRVADGSYTLWEERMDGHAFSILLTCPRADHDFEGDLLLVFCIDSVAIYSITFTLAGGRDVGIDSEQVLLVTAVQGMAGKIEPIRQATRICEDTPAHCLLAAAEGVAVCLQAAMLAGIGLDQQVQKQVGEDPRFSFDYDAFWSAVAGREKSGIFYLLPVPFPQRPIESVKSKHRSREIRRRRLKARIMESVRVSFREKCLGRQDMAESAAAVSGGAR